MNTMESWAGQVEKTSCMGHSVPLLCGCLIAVPDGVEIDKDEFYNGCLKRACKACLTAFVGTVH